jgi:hypothetical protein
MRVRIIVLIIAAASALGVTACGGSPYNAPYELYGGREVQQFGGAPTCPSC